MSGPSRRLAQSNGREGKATRAAVRKSTRTSRIPIERLLPMETLALVRAEAASIGKITPQKVARLDERLGISEQFGLSRRRLQNYLKREQAKSATASKTSPPNINDNPNVGRTMPDAKVGRAMPDAKVGQGVPDADMDATSFHEPNQHGRDGQPSPSGPDDWETKVNAHRRRQHSVAAILDQTFGRWGQGNPDLWERRAYLMLVGLVYERLATSEEEISTDELAKLAKALAENRRVEARRAKDARDETADHESGTPLDELPEGFADLVRKVYGTNLQLST